MHTPSHFQWNDQQEIIDFIRQFPQGQLTVNGEQVPFASHLPFLFDGEVLTTHLYRNNPLVEAMQQNPKVLVAFSVPGAYISPTWYEKLNTVPTWNYLAVHLYGDALVLDNHEDKDRIMREMIEHLEPEYISHFNQLDEKYKANMIAQVCGVKIRIKQVEAQKKLSQNKSEADRQNIIHQLEERGRPEDSIIAEWMKKQDNSHII